MLRRPVTRAAGTIGAAHRPNGVAQALHTPAMRNEIIPVPPSPEQPPLAPYDPPEPAPQAAAWRRALKVIGCPPPRRELHMIKSSVSRSAVRRNGVHHS